MTNFEYHSFHVSQSTSVPEQFREKCFEILLNNLLTASAPGNDTKDDHKIDKSKDDKREQQSSLPITAQVRVLLRKTNVTEEDLSNVLLYEEDELHFIREPNTKKVTQGQLEWSLLLALKNAIMKNKLEVDPEEVRSMCQEKGYYDSANFAANFTRAKIATMFKGEMIPQGEAQGLTEDGIQALGALIKKLASNAS